MATNIAARSCTEDDSELDYPSDDDVDALSALAAAPLSAVQAFHAAVLAGDAMQARAAADRLEAGGENMGDLLANGDHDGRTLLHMVAALPLDVGSILGRCDVVGQLLVYSGCVDGETLLGHTPLLYAVKAAVDIEPGDPMAEGGARLAMVTFLLAMKADPDAGDIMGETPLMEAVCAGDLEVCQLLLESRADPSLESTSGLVATDLAEGCPKLEALLQCGHGVAAPDGVVAGTCLGGAAETAQHHAPPASGEAASQGAAVRPAGDHHTERALDELQAALGDGDGHQVDAKMQALQDAVSGDASDGGDGGAKCGAALQSRNAGGGLLLQICRAPSPGGGALDAAKLLLSGRADPDVTDACGDTALKLAVRAAITSGSLGLGLVCELLEKGADPTAGDGSGYTPLMDAILAGHTELSQLLFKMGADSLVAKELQI